MRHAGDTSFGALLERARRANLTPDDLSTLNSRVDWNIYNPVNNLRM